MGGGEPEAGLGRPLLPQEAGLSHIGGEEGPGLKHLWEVPFPGNVFPSFQGLSGPGPGESGQIGGNMEELGLLPLPRPRKMVAAGIGGEVEVVRQPTYCCPCASEEIC